jgi:hypothetical protein
MSPQMSPLQGWQAPLSRSQKLEQQSNPDSHGLWSGWQSDRFAVQTQLDGSSDWPEAQAATQRPPQVTWPGAQEELDEALVWPELDWPDNNDGAPVPDVACQAPRSPGCGPARMPAAAVGHAGPF